MKMHGIIYLFNKTYTMKKLFLIPATLLAVVSFQACNNNQQNTDSVDSAQEMNDSMMVNSEAHSTDFLTEAASGGMMEVELGKLAQEQASHPRVKAFGQMMVTDHTKANSELMALAQSKSVALPAEMGEDHQEHFNDLKAKKGADFDKAYMDMMVKDHKEDVDAFEDAAQDTEDAEVSAFASKTLPVLKMHLDSAQAIHDALK